MFLLLFYCLNNKDSDVFENAVELITTLIKKYSAKQKNEVIAQIYHQVINLKSFYMNCTDNEISIYSSSLFYLFILILF